MFLSTLSVTFHQYHSNIRVIQEIQLEWSKKRSHSSCETIEARIQKIMQDLDVLDNQLRILEVEGMNQLNPWRYFALQPQVDRLIRKKHSLQDAWHHAMNELAICRSGQSSPHHPKQSRHIKRNTRTATLLRTSLSASFVVNRTLAQPVGPANVNPVDVSRPYWLALDQKEQEFFPSQLTARGKCLPAQCDNKATENTEDQKRT
jgi:hypothetical protein